MIKRPEEIGKIIKTFDRAGYDVISAGQCVTGSILGDSPLDWDMYTGLGKAPHVIYRYNLPGVLPTSSPWRDQLRSSFRYTISPARLWGNMPMEY